MNRRTFLLLLPLLLLPPHRTCAPEMAASVSRIDLTPPLTMKASLGGYGARLSQPAAGVHDRVFAKALCVSNGDRRFALVTADMLGVPPPVKPAVLKNLSTEGWDEEQIMLLPSHSHTSIDLTAINPNNRFGIPELGLYQPELFEWVVEKTSSAIQEASVDPAPVRIGTASTALEGWVANRREGNLQTDPILTVTRIDRASGDPMAVLVHWAAHPTFMSETEMMFSGGWPGHLQRALEALVGGGVSVLYMNGAEGDQRPVARPDSGPSNWERAERYGGELALEAWRLWETIDPKQRNDLQFHLEPVDLPPRSWHPDFMQTGGAEYGIREETAQVLLEELSPTQTRIGLVRIADLLIVGIPGEAAATLGLEIRTNGKERTGVPHVVVGGLANEWVSYILTPEEYARGGYEASVSFYGPRLGPTILEAAARAVANLD